MANKIDYTDKTKFDKFFVNVEKCVKKSDSEYQGKKTQHLFLQIKPGVAVRLNEKVKDHVGGYSVNLIETRFGSVFLAQVHQDMNYKYATRDSEDPDKWNMARVPNTEREFKTITGKMILDAARADRIKGWKLAGEDTTRNNAPASTKTKTNFNDSKEEVEEEITL